MQLSKQSGLVTLAIAVAADSGEQVEVYDVTTRCCYKSYPGVLQQAGG